MFRQVMTTNLLEDLQTHTRTISCTRIHAHIYMYCDTSCQMAWENIVNLSLAMICNDNY